MTKIRYKYIENVVLNIFKQFSPNKLCLPIDVGYLCSLAINCKVWSYDEYSNFTAYPVNEIIELMGSDSGCSLYDAENDRYLILYNNQCSPKRNRWTIVHELAHILLNHFNILNVQQIAENNNYSFIENEANYFVSLLLCPFPVMKELNIKSSITIESLCVLSAPAAQNCFRDFANTPGWAYKCSYTNNIKKLFKPYIDERLHSGSCYKNANTITDNMFL